MDNINEVKAEITANQLNIICGKAKSGKTVMSLYLACLMSTDRAVVYLNLDSKPNAITEQLELVKTMGAINHGIYVVSREEELEKFLVALDNSKPIIVFVDVIQQLQDVSSLIDVAKSLDATLVFIYRGTIGGWRTSKLYVDGFNEITHEQQSVLELLPECA